MELHLFIFVSFIRYRHEHTTFRSLVKQHVPVVSDQFDLVQCWCLLNQGKKQKYTCDVILWIDIFGGMETDLKSKQ